MNEPLPTDDNESLPLSVERRVDKVCARFETACRAGGRPHLEDFLGDATGTERLGMTRELLRLEVHYRRQRGEVPCAEDYRQRFRELSLKWLTRAVAVQLAAESSP